jgi:phosphoglycerol transferase MdoB-like AlkP superfamily enzyme
MTPPESSQDTAPRPRHARVRFALRLIGAQLLLLLALRAVFYWSFRESGGDLSATDLVGSLWVGARFDLRLVLIVSLPILILQALAPLDPVRSSLARRAWGLFTALLATLLLVLYVVDLAHYDYLHERLNVGLLDQAQEPAIAAQMVWETYPVVWGLLGLVSFVVLWTWLLRRHVFATLDAEPSALTPLRRRLAWGGLFAFVALGIYGKASFYPLRWSDAYTRTNPFATALALNPVLFLLDSLPDRETPYDEALVRQHYPLLCELLEVDEPNAETLDFTRRVVPEKRLPGTPNLVIVHLESWSGFQTGILGEGMNPASDLDPSPFFDSIAREGLLFTNFFIPRPPTARSVFAMITGIPDVAEVRTSSRNPRIVTQHTLINELEGYERYYFLGGSATWANIRGLLAHNIEDLHIYEEGDYESPRGDVWGISDQALFEEAVGVLDREDGPVFAFIQTSGNHRPYTIPEDVEDFEVEQVDDATLLANGFPSLEAYNGFRFMDHSVKHLFEAVRGTKLEGNTVFVFYGDHGVPAPHGIQWERLGLPTVHVPLLIYAPGLIDEPRRYDQVASSVDILPTALGLLGVPYENQTLGRDLLVERPAEAHFAFLYNGLLDDELCLKPRPGGADRLYEYRVEGVLPEVSEGRPADLARMQEQFEALKAWCFYMLYHNAPPAPRVGEAAAR